MFLNVVREKHFAFPVGGRRVMSHAAATGVHWKIKVPAQDIVNRTRKTDGRNQYGSKDTLANPAYQLFPKEN